MKRLILTLAVVASLAECKSNNHEMMMEDTATAVMAEEVYACPMNCEGDKTYAEPGKCPVCKMDLAVVAQDGTAHDDGEMHMEH